MYLTSVDLLLFFGIASAVLSTFAFIPYILDTIARRTRPQRASWLIWSVLGSIAFVSQVYEGATASLWFAGVQITGTIIVFTLSIWAGKGSYLSKSDYAILLAASVGLVLWYITDTAAYALAITISISLLGGFATVAKAYRDPDSETLITWVVSFLASAFALMSVGSTDLILLAYPLYLFTLYLAFIVAISLGRARIASANRAPARTVHRLRIATFLSGLRTTADAIIVTAAFIFAFNWVGNNSSAFDRSASHASVIDSAVIDGSTGNHATTGELAASEVFISTERRVGLRERVRSPLEVVATEVDQFALANGLIAESSMVKTTAISPSIVALAVESPASSNQPSYLTQEGFLVLDAADPFAELIVTSKNARLAPVKHSLKEQNNQLESGARLRALATNGKWFKVQTRDGTHGYIHHSKVVVEALSVNAGSKAG